MAACSKSESFPKGVYAEHAFSKQTRVPRAPPSRVGKHIALIVSLCTRSRDKASDCVAPQLGRACHATPLMAIYCFRRTENGRPKTTEFFSLFSKCPQGSEQSLNLSTFQALGSLSRAICSALSGIWFTSTWSDLFLRKGNHGRSLTCSNGGWPLLIHLKNYGAWNIFKKWGGKKHLKSGFLLNRIFLIIETNIKIIHNTETHFFPLFLDFLMNIFTFTLYSHLHTHTTAKWQCTH